MNTPEPDDAVAPVELRAHAKLTRTLRIVGVRDDGYHLIDAEMVSLELHDLLRIAPGDGLSVVRDGTTTPGEDDDLVVRALRAVGRRAAVELHKHIPAGAGLGGGSSDAAAVLRWAGVDDLELAARIGADVAFCLRGGRARVQGIGELVEPLAETAHAMQQHVSPLVARQPRHRLVRARGPGDRLVDDLGGGQGRAEGDFAGELVGHLEVGVGLRGLVVEVERVGVLELHGFLPPPLQGRGRGWGSSRRGPTQAPPQPLP